MAGGSYNKIPSGGWRGRVMIDGVRYSVTRATKRAAQLAVAELEVARRAQHSTARQSRGRQQNITLAELIHEWWGRHERKLAPSTAKDYRRAIDGHVMGHPIAATKIRTLHQRDLNAFYDDLEADGLGAERIRRVHNILSVAFTYAVRNDLVAGKPTDKADPPAVTERDVDPPTPADVVKIVSVADTIKPGLSMFVHLAAVTGARRGELIALRRSDIDLETATVTIARAVSVGDGDFGIGQNLVEKDTKTHAVRRVALDGGAVDAIRQHYRDQASEAEQFGLELADDPRVFAGWGSVRDVATRYGDLPWRPESTSRWFSQAVAEAGLSGVRLHDLRHAAATQMLAAGVDVRTGAGRLGHKRTDTFLNRYAHVVPAADQNAADTLADIYRIGNAG